MTMTYLTPEEVASRYAGRVTVDRLAQWRWRKKGPRHVKIGRAVLYPLQELETWEASRLVTNPEAEAAAAARL